jgi:hypothetical protein
MFTNPDLNLPSMSKEKAFTTQQSLPNSPVKTLKLEESLPSTLRGKRNSAHKINTRSIYYSSKIEDVIEQLWQQNS